MNYNNVKLDSTHPVVSRLIELQGDEPDQSYCKNRLSVSPTTWLRVKNGNYAADDHSRVLKKLSADLSEILDSLALEAGIRETPIIPLRHITDARDALHLAFAEDRNRLVIALADTGGGKTMIARSIARDFPSRVASVEATESWRNSYLAGIAGIAAVCGIEKLPNNSRLAEEKLFEELNARPRIIVIDEGNYFGSSCLNLVKAILNKTRSIVVILAMPVFWNFICNKARQEARQIRNRTAALLEFGKLRASDVRSAMEKSVPEWHSLNDSSTVAVNEITAAANNFGLWNTVFSVASFITQESAGATVTLDIVRSAITDVSALRR
jgi:hypothetical protein